ncbi:MAG: DUF2946 domain-containing protein [Caulobacter sp.]
MQVARGHRRTGGWLLWLAILAVMLPGLSVGAVAATRDQALIQICSANGATTIAVDDRGQPAKAGFAGLPCQDCLAASLAAVETASGAVAPVHYASAIPVGTAERQHARPLARGPPRPPGQAPPLG